MNRLVTILKATTLLAATLLLVLLSFAVRELQMYTERELKPMVNAQSAQITALLKTVNDTSSFEEKKLDIVATNIVALTGDADDVVEQVRGALLDDKFGLIPRSSELMGTLNQTARDADAVTATLNGEILMTGAEARKQLAPIAGTLEDAQSLLEEGTVQLRIEGSDSSDLLKSLNRTVTDADAVIADPQIKQTIAHVDSSAESIDDALLPWRKKAALLKMILEKVGNAVLNNAVLFFK